MATPTSGNTMRRWVVQGSYWASARIARKTATPAGRKPTSGIARAPSSITATRPIRRGHEPSSALRGRPPPKARLRRMSSSEKGINRRRMLGGKTEDAGADISVVSHQNTAPSRMNAAAMMVPGRSREDDGSVDIGALPTGGAAPAEDAPAQQRVGQRQEGQRDDGERDRPAEEHAREVAHRRADGPALHEAPPEIGRAQ